MRTIFVQTLVPAFCSPMSGHFWPDFGGFARDQAAELNVNMPWSWSCRTRLVGVGDLNAQYFLCTSEDGNCSCIVVSFDAVVVGQTEASSRDKRRCIRALSNGFLEESESDWQIATSMASSGEAAECFPERVHMFTKRFEQSNTDEIYAHLLPFLFEPNSTTYEALWNLLQASPPVVTHDNSR